MDFLMSEDGTVYRFPTPTDVWGKVTNSFELGDFLFRYVCQGNPPQLPASSETWFCFPDGTSFLGYWRWPQSQSEGHSYWATNFSQDKGFAFDATKIAQLSFRMFGIHPGYRINYFLMKENIDVSR